MDLKKLMGGLSNSGALSGFMGGVAGGGVTSMLTSKKGRKVGKGALKVGALAAVGGLAWKAYQSYSANNQGGQAAQGAGANQPGAQGHAHQGGFNQQATQQQLSNNYGNPQQAQTARFDFAPARIQQQQFEEVVEDTNPNGQMLLMRAMITAAHSDGHIDDQERQQIFAQVDTMDLSVEEKATLFDELRKPLGIAELVSQVPDAQTGIEVYAASASAIDLERQDSQAYLDALANQLCIPSELTANIQQQLKAY
jgi:uncharacterized membrane protein YebE (DUF533 family)